MVIICPKCRVKLKVSDEKITPNGKKFRCPKCNSLLFVKKKTKESIKKAVTEKPLIDDKAIQRAKRLIRTILSDIHFYNQEKVKESILKGTFKEDFKSQLSEGMKLYKTRIPEEVRQKGDFFNQEVEKFIKDIEKKYKE